MKKTNLIFLSIILMEGIFIIVSLILGDRCGYACDLRSLLNPFGKELTGSTPVYCV